MIKIEHTMNKSIFCNFQKACLVLLLMLVTILNARADVTFNWVSPQDDSEEFRSKYEYVHIYKDGVQLNIKSFYPYEENQLVIPLESGSYSYSTTMGHVGDFDSPNQVQLTIHTLILRLISPDGLPISDENIYIYRNGAEIKYERTNENGYARFFLSPSNQYAYRCSFGEGALTGLDNNSVEQRVEKEISANTITFVAKYGNYPIPDQFTLVSSVGEDGNQYGTCSSRENGKVQFNVIPNQPYYLQNKLGITTGPYIASSNINFLEYQKITFVSDKGNDPAVLKGLKVSAGDKTNTKSVTTDGKGRASIYLLPGNYQWHHLSGTGNFTVSNEDIEIPLTPELTQLKFINNGHGISGLKYTIAGGSKGVTNSSGVAEVNLIADGANLSVNGLGNYYFTEGSGDINIPVYKLNVDGGTQFTSFVLQDSKYNNVKFPCGVDIYVLPGKYKVGVSSTSTEMVDIDIKNDTEFTLSKHKLKVKVIDTNGMPVSDFTIWCNYNGRANQSATTNSSGECNFNLQPGEYLIQDQTFQLLSESITVSSDTKVEVTIPTEVNFTIENNGIPYSGQAVWNPIGRRACSMQALDGKISARINADIPGTISITGYHTADIPLTIKDGININLVDAKVSCTGRGIVVPTLGENSDGLIIEGQTLRLKAIPTQYGTFSHWTINGIKYNEDVIDYTVGAEGIDAVATFDEVSSSGSGTTVLNSAKWSVTPNPAITEIHFPEEINARVSVYSASGQEVQSLRVIGNTMSVAELTPGVYFLIATDSNNSQPIGTARFIKR